MDAIELVNSTIDDARFLTSFDEHLLDYFYDLSGLTCAALTGREHIDQAIIVSSLHDHSPLYALIAEFVFINPELFLFLPSEQLPAKRLDAFIKALELKVPNFRYTSDLFNAKSVRQLFFAHVESNWLENGIYREHNIVAPASRHLIDANIATQAQIDAIFDDAA